MELKVSNELNQESNYQGSTFEFLGKPFTLPEDSYDYFCLEVQTSLGGDHFIQIFCSKDYEAGLDRHLGTLDAPELTSLFLELNGNGEHELFSAIPIFIDNKLNPNLEKQAKEDLVDFYQILANKKEKLLFNQNLIEEIENENGYSEHLIITNPNKIKF